MFPSSPPGKDCRNRARSVCRRAKTAGLHPPLGTIFSEKGRFTGVQCLETATPPSYFGAMFAGRERSTGLPYLLHGKLCNATSIARLCFASGKDDRSSFISAKDGSVVFDVRNPCLASAKHENQCLTPVKHELLFNSFPSTRTTRSHPGKGSSRLALRNVHRHVVYDIRSLPSKLSMFKSSQCHLMPASPLLSTKCSNQKYSARLAPGSSNTRIVAGQQPSGVVS